VVVFPDILTVSTREALEADVFAFGFGFGVGVLSGAAMSGEAIIVATRAIFDPMIKWVFRFFILGSLAGR
jgi:hypothetical protein